MLQPPPDSLVFDLDGTLWDASAPTARCWTKLLRALGVDGPEVTPLDVQRVTGMPHGDAVRAAFPHLDPTTVRTLIDLSEVEDGEAIARDGADLYPGVATLIPQLAQRFPLYIVSNCQSGYVETFFAWSGLERYFTDIEYAGRTGKPKTENLGLLIARNRLARPAYVGDTKGDEDAARGNSVPFIFASYGFGQATQCNWQIESFEDLAALLG